MTTIVETAVNFAALQPSYPFFLFFHALNCFSLLKQREIARLPGGEDQRGFLHIYLIGILTTFASNIFSSYVFGLEHAQFIDKPEQITLVIFAGAVIENTSLYSPVYFPSVLKNIIGSFIKQRGILGALSLAPPNAFFHVVLACIVAPSASFLVRDLDLIFRGKLTTSSFTPYVDNLAGYFLLLPFLIFTFYDHPYMKHLVLLFILIDDHLFVIFPAVMNFFGISSTPKSTNATLNATLNANANANILGAPKQDNIATFTPKKANTSNSNKNNSNNSVQTPSSESSKKHKQKHA